MEIWEVNMLFWNRTVAVEEPVAVKPELDLNFNGDELSEYSRVASAIGFESSALLEERLKVFLAENGICVYPIERVVQYLNSKLGKSWFERTWCWRPLREKDKDANLFLTERGRGNGCVDNTAGWYRRRVPLPVLFTVEKIHKAFPEVCFYVSDSPKNCDPFLMVTAMGVDCMAIERWNEPSFRM